jgi:diguanylate cyclase (GGDEF)-like protein
VIVLPETPLETAVNVAEQIRGTLAASSFGSGGLDVRLTSSFGVCCATSAVEQPEQILAKADELLYRSKRDGRNRVSS